MEETRKSHHAGKRRKVAVDDTRTPATALLTDLAENLAHYAKARLNASPVDAKAFGEEAAVFIADLWGGQVIYIPKDMAGRIRSRDSKIYAEFSGENHAELARKYKLSFQHIHRIIKKERERRSVKQHNLPMNK